MEVPGIHRKKKKTKPCERLRKLGYKPIKADPDPYLREAVMQNGERCCKCIVAYVSDLLCCGENPEAQMDEGEVL